MLPYREIDQSGVLFTALAFGKPLVLSAVGGFPEVAAHGRGASSCRPATRRARRGARASCSATAAARERSRRRARARRPARYSWDAIARAHLAPLGELARVKAPDRSLFWVAGGLLVYAQAATRWLLAAARARCAGAGRAGAGAPAPAPPR